MLRKSILFRLSKYADRLLKHIEENNDFIVPETKKNEVVNFIKGGLEDLCVSEPLLNGAFLFQVIQNMLFMFGLML